MFRRQNLRTICVDFSIADADFVDAVHQFRNEVKMKTGRAEGSNLLFGREDHLGVFNCVLEIVFLHFCLTISLRSRISIHRDAVSVLWEANGFPYSTEGGQENAP